MVAMAKKAWFALMNWKIRMGSPRSPVPSHLSHNQQRLGQSATAWQRRRHGGTGAEPMHVRADEFRTGTFASNSISGRFELQALGGSTDDVLALVQANPRLRARRRRAGRARAVWAGTTSLQFDARRFGNLQDRSSGDPALFSNPRCVRIDSKGGNDCFGQSTACRCFLRRQHWVRVQTLHALAGRRCLVCRKHRVRVQALHAFAGHSVSLCRECWVSVHTRHALDSLTTTCLGKTIYARHKVCLHRPIDLRGFSVRY
jgi:hypothetical protein